MDADAAQKILIVEDDPDIARIACLILEREGFAVTHLLDATQALQQIAASTPHLIITDVMMPGIDGFQLLTMLKQSAATAQIPVMMMSALADDHNVRRGELLGADYYLKKPFMPAQLIAAVKGVLAKAVVKQRMIELNK